MVDRVAKYQNLIDQESGVTSRAEKLAKMEEVLEKHKGKLFLSVLMEEHAHAERTRRSTFGRRDRYSGAHTYSASYEVITGVLQGMERSLSCFKRFRFYSSRIGIL